MTQIANIVVREVATEYHVSGGDIVGRSRLAHLIAPRFTAVRLMRDFKMSSPEIGRIFSGRDHTTILNALSRFDVMARDDGFRGRYEAIKTRVYLANGAFFTRASLRPVFKSVRASKTAEANQ